jgi:hypothetical protein
MECSIEQLRIAGYAQGWNDAACGRAPQSQDLAYSLGYRDANL